MQSILMEEFHRWHLWLSTLSVISTFLTNLLTFSSMTRSQVLKHMTPINKDRTPINMILHHYFNQLKWISHYVLHESASISFRRWTHIWIIVMKSHLWRIRHQHVWSNPWICCWESQCFWCYFPGGMDRIGWSIETHEIQDSGDQKWPESNMTDSANVSSW